MYSRIIFVISAVILASLPSVFSRLDTPPLHLLARRVQAAERYYTRAGDNVGGLLRGIQRNDIERGQVLAKPGSIKPYTPLHASVYDLERTHSPVAKPVLKPYKPTIYPRLRGVERNDIERGQVLAKPGSIKPHKPSLHASAYDLERTHSQVVKPVFKPYKPTIYPRMRGMERNDIERGQVLVKPGSIKPDVKGRRGNGGLIYRRGQQY